jgi:hypothetical protein
MIWPEVAKAHLRSLERAAVDRRAKPRLRLPAGPLAESVAELPVLKLDHLKRLTDDVGLLQHAVASVPNYWEGYTTDDNARGLILGVLLEELGTQWVALAAGLPSRYMAFLWYAFNPKTSRFRNFLGYDRIWREEIGSPDCHGRAVWALATVLGRSRREGLRRAAERLFEAALPTLTSFTEDLRPAALALVGLHDYLRRYPGDRAVQQTCAILAERLLAAYQRNASHDWPWFEEKLSYVNAKLPHALLLAGHSAGRPEMVEAASIALDWLARLQTAADGHFAPIGHEGFFHRKNRRARFDQQPVEAYAMLSACLAAHRVTSDKRWEQEAHRALGWFLGRNDISLALYDPSTGGCYDGLQREGVNTNQGAESTLSLLMSLAELRLHQQIVPSTGGDLGRDGQAVAVDRLSSRRPLEVVKPAAVDGSRTAR